MSTDNNVWMVNVNDTDFIVKDPNFPEGEIRSVSFGNTCLNVVTGDGKLFNSKIKDGSLEVWKQPPELTQFELTQVESGLSHHVAITTDNKLVSWGKNNRGQLGRGDIPTRKSKKGKRQDVIFSASLIPFFKNMRISSVSCGNLHTLCLSEEGQVYSWGANDYNQLGSGNSSTLHYTTPHFVEKLECFPIAQISAGGQHSFAVSTTGVVFCWGSNEFGQLGFENNKCESQGQKNKDYCYEMKYPADCIEKVRSVSCGENHTAFLTMDGRVYTCGLGSSGQLGHHPCTENQFVPREIDELNNNPISRIACGRDYTTVYIQSTNTLHYFGAQKKCVTNLPSGIFGETSLTCGKDFFVIYKPPSIGDANNGFTSQSLTLDEVLGLMKNPGNVSDQAIRNKLNEALSQATIVNGSFRLQNRGQGFSESGHGFDLQAADEFFRQSRELSYRGVAEKALKSLIESLSHDTSKLDSLRILLLLPCCLYVKEICVYSDALVMSLSTLINGLHKDQKVTLGKWLKSISPHYFKRYMMFFRRYVKTNSRKLVKVFDATNMTNIRCAIEPSVKVMDMLNEINNCRFKPIPYKKFYIQDLVNKINITEDFNSRLKDIKDREQSTFRFCKYPFLFDTVSKCMLLKSKCQEKMKHDPEVINNRCVNNKQSRLEVRRESIVKDTRECLSQERKDLLKQLDVIFLGEIDYCGDGIRQEFFQVLIEKLLHEDFGAIYYEDESNVQWFRVKGENESSNLADLRFIGLICGLALYNNVTLHLQFPSALYKKLLDERVSLQDLFELKPCQYRSCLQLLEYDYEDIEDTFMLDFATPFELCPNGDDIKVNNSNTKEYVQKLTDYYINVHAKKEFESFRDGFYTAMPKDLLNSFHAKELQEVLVGNEKYDFEALEKITVYAGGYHKDHHTIRMFWEVFHEMELEDQKDFLIFLTGTYRIPAYGIARLKFTIFPRDGDIPDEMLPHAYTCTNSLELPVYTRKECLKKMVLAAAKFSSGFGFN